MDLLKVLVIGSTGRIGSRVVDELSSRGHHVTRGVRRDSSQLGMDAVEIDPREPESVRAAASGHDAVISALGGARSGQPGLVIDVAHPILTGLESANVERLLIVGGAGSLETENGIRLIDSPGFPESWKPGSQAQVDALEIYRDYQGPVEWTYLSPSEHIEPGVRSGKILVGSDRLLRDAEGRSRVSMEDFAMALVDELESPRFSRSRFTVRSA